jgi:hypothetical protein
MTCAAAAADMLPSVSFSRRQTSTCNHPAQTSSHHAQTHHEGCACHLAFFFFILFTLVALEMPHYSIENVWGRAECLVFQRLVGSSQLPMNLGPQRAA